MIFSREEVMDEGTEYRFKVAPVDPNDPFRGKYIYLNFEDNAYIVEDESEWYRGEPAYVLFYNDEEGFAKIRSVQKFPPVTESNYLETTIDNVIVDDSTKLYVDYPFTRFYMEESKAFAAEIIYQKSLRDTSQVTCALVSINNGEAVLKDVLINDISIRELARAK